MNGFAGKEAKDCQINDIIIMGGAIKKIINITPLASGKFLWALSDKKVLTIPGNIKVLVQRCFQKRSIVRLVVVR